MTVRLKPPQQESVSFKGHRNSTHPARNGCDCKTKTTPARVCLKATEIVLKATEIVHTLLGTGVTVRLKPPQQESVSFKGHRNSTHPARNGCDCKTSKSLSLLKAEIVHTLLGTGSIALVAAVSYPAVRRRPTARKGQWSTTKYFV